MKDTPKVYSDFLGTNYALTAAHHAPCGDHVHTGWEILIVTEGKIHNKVNGTLFKNVKKGDVFIMGPPHVHSIMAAKPHAHRDLYCSDETMQKICEGIHPTLYNRLQESPVHFSLTKKQLSNAVAELETIDTLLRPLPAPEQKYYPTLRSFCHNFIAYLLNIYEIQQIQAEFDVPQWLLDFVQQLMSIEVFSKRIQDIVALSPYSHPQLSRIFKKYFDTSLIDFISDLRLLRAESLLLHTDFSLQEISSQLGYASSTILCQKFKQRYGYSPIQYRRRMLAKNRKKVVV